ncbi:hypothetical protein CTAYLR_006684 [Chrysophaeum taylorii]|uniref:RING-CH-type domain-containing protein n=1 Tax=Chrysophaeum taylorii TaxID=2483200 RepID=A0AAD7UFF6_9STRA|nr:hypothetical protein CTAYLR_006684 [Chrysophaeum taylorii]
MSSRQCRFCLEYDDEGMVAPCSCSGSAKWVHESCLERWRREGRGRKRCGVCGASWSTPAPAVVRSLFLRRVRTARRYQVPAERLSSELEGRLRVSMVAGGLVLQTESRARLFDAAEPRPVEAAPREVIASRISRLRGLLTTPSEGQVEHQSSSTVRSLIAAVVRARGLRHWHRGAFLVLYVGEREASDGSDVVVAGNLTRPATNLGAGLEDEADSDAPTRRLSWLRSAALALRRQHEEDEDDEAVRANRALRQLRALGVDVSAFRGGPVHSDTPLGLLVLKRPPQAAAPPVLDDLDALREAVGDIEPWRDLGPSRRAFVGSVPDLVACARLFCADYRWTAKCYCWAGVAVWSSNQLIAEITKHSWALSSANLDDLDNAGPDLWRSAISRPDNLAAPDPPATSSPV